MSNQAEQDYYRKYQREEFLERGLPDNIDRALKNICDAFAHLYKLADRYQQALQDSDFNPRGDSILPYEVEVSAGPPVLVKITVHELLPHMWKANPFVRDKVHRALRDVWQTTFREAAKKAVEKLTELCGGFAPLPRVALVTKVYYPERTERDLDNYLLKFANNGFRGLLIHDDSYLYEPYIICFAETYQKSPRVEIFVKELTPEDEDFFQRFCHFRRDVVVENNDFQWY